MDENHSEWPDNEWPIGAKLLYYFVIRLLFALLITSCLTSPKISGIDFIIPKGWLFLGFFSSFLLVDLLTLGNFSPFHQNQGQSRNKFAFALSIIIILFSLLIFIGFIFGLQYIRFFGW